MKKILLKVISLIICLSLCFSFAGCYLFRNESFKPTLPDSGVVANQYKLSTNEEVNPEYDRVKAVAKVERSVVAIEIKYTATTTDGTKKDVTGFGSGVIVDNGNPQDNLFYILTCHHVIGSMGNIKVYVPDENTRNYTDSDYDTDFVFTGVIESKINSGEVRLVGGDKLADVAVLILDVSGTGVSKDKIVSAVLPHDGYAMQRGESVFAIGNPSGKRPMTVSDGIISYLDRETFLSEIGLMTLTQIDVQTNHGSSGGALFNYYGELIGITNAGSDEYEGMNFSIPFKHTYLQGGFVSIAEQLIATHLQTFEGANYGYVSGSWQLGIIVEQISTFNSTQLKIKQIVEGSNCDGPLQEGDIILSVSYSGNKSYSNSVSSLSEFTEAMDYLRSYARLGDTITLKVQRNSEQAPISILLKKQFIFCDTGAKLPTNN